MSLGSQPWLPQAPGVGPAAGLWVVCGKATAVGLVLGSAHCSQSPQISGCSPTRVGWGFPLLFRKENGIRRRAALA